MAAGRQAIVLQSFIAAPGADVWSALHARTDLLFDGLPAKAWPEGGEEQAPFHMTRPWPFTQDAGGATDVSVTLHDMGGGVRVDLRHALNRVTLFALIFAIGILVDDAIVVVENIHRHYELGWTDPRQASGEGQERASGERYFISGEIPAEASAVYRALTDGAVLGRWSGDAFGAMPVAEEIEDKFIRWKGPSEVTAILRPTPRGTHLAIAEYGIRDRAASGRWPAVFESLARFLG